MHILLCIPSLAFGKGGAERVAAELAHAMSARGHSVSVAYRSSRKHSLAPPKYSLPESAWRITWNNTLASIYALRKHILQLQPDIILVFYSTWQVVHLFEMLHDLGIPLCFQECSNPYRIMAENWGYAPNAFTMRSDILSCAAGIRVTQKKYKESFPVELQDRVHAFPNAFQLEKRNIKFQRPTKNILHVGGAKKHKQLMWALEAFCKIQEDYPDWTMTVCTSATSGDGEYFSGILEYIRGTFAPGRIRVLKNVEDMRSVYSVTDIHIITSLSEGLPNCVCEAMCHGIPSIGYVDSIGTNLLIKHGSNGLLASAQPRVDSLAHALTRLMEDHDQREVLGRQAHKDAAAFNPEAIYNAWEAFFEKSLARAALLLPATKNVDALRALCFDYTGAEKESYIANTKQKAELLCGRDVVFWGCGSVYEDYKHLFKKTNPIYIISDMIEGVEYKDDIKVINSKEIDINLLKCPIIIFSGFDKVIAHRLLTQYKLKAEIVCIGKENYSQPAYEMLTESYKYIAIEALLKKKSWMYNKNVIGTVCIGNSQCSSAIDPEYFSRETFNMGLDGLDLYSCFCILQRLLDTADGIRDVIIFVSLFSFGLNQELTRYKRKQCIYKHVFGVNYRDNRNFNDCLYTQTEISDFCRKVDLSAHDPLKKGYYRVIKYEKQSDCSISLKEIAKKHMRENMRKPDQMQWLEAINKLCAERDKNLLLIAPPVREDYKNLLPRYSILYKKISSIYKIINMYDVTCFDYSDFLDFHHLTAEGAKKFSRELNGLLQQE